MTVDERPPCQYLPAKGTSFCLMPNDYDKNVYGQCSYIGNRTLIRCSQIRRKEDLVRNNGHCDQHLTLRTAIKERFERDNVILKNSCSSKSPYSKKFTRTVRSDTLVVEQDPALLPNFLWTSESVDNVYRNSAIESFPLPSTDVMTEKEILLHRMIQIKKEIDVLNVEKTRMEVQAAYMERKKKRKGDPLAIVNQGRKEGEQSPSKKRCIFGRQNDEAIRLLIDHLILTVSGEKVKEEKMMFEGCGKIVLLGSDYCIRHAEVGIKKPTFSKCKKCDSFVFEESGGGLCPVHNHVKKQPKRPRVIADVMDNEEPFSDEEYYSEMERPVIKKYRRPPSKTQISFSSVPPGSFAHRRLSEKFAGALHDAARCRPFSKEFFPIKPAGRTTIPYGQAPLTRPIITAAPRPPPDMTNARLVTVTRGPVPVYQRTNTIQRIATQDRQRNRLQQEEDMKAAASITDSLEGRHISGTQYRVVNAARPVGRINTQFRAGQPLPSLAVNIGNLPDEIKAQPVGAFLKSHALASPGSPNFSVTRPRISMQTAIRKPDIPLSNSVMSGIVRNAAVPNPSQRHQIASVEVPFVHRQSVVPPHRLQRHPQIAAPAGLLPLRRSLPPSQPAGAPIAPPKVIPLERNEREKTIDQRKTEVTRPLPLPANFVTQLVDEGKVPDFPPILQPVDTPPKTVEEGHEIVRKKTRPSLPLPKIPNVLSRSKTTKSVDSLVSTSMLPSPVKQTKTPDKIEGEAQKKEKKEKPPPRQGSRRSSRLEKSTDSTEDPLSLLADVSATVIFEGKKGL